MHPAPEVEDAHAAQRPVSHVCFRMRLSLQLWCVEIDTPVRAAITHLQPRAERRLALDPHALAKVIGR